MTIVWLSDFDKFVKGDTNKDSVINYLVILTFLKRFIFDMSEQCFFEYVSTCATVFDEEKATEVLGQYQGCIIAWGKH